MDLNHFESNDRKEQKEVQDIDVKSEYQQGRKRKKKNNWFSLLAAGIIGSVLTMVSAPLTNEYITPLFSNMGSESNFNVQAAEDKEDPVDAVEIQETTPASDDITEMVEEASKAIVGIVNIQNRNNYFTGGIPKAVKSGTGSGVLFKKSDSEAYIVTNYHVIENANKLEVSLQNGEKEMAEVVGTDPLTDLAVLKIDSEHVTSILSFGDSSKLKPGEQVLAIGNPLGLEFSRTVTQGIISATERTIPVSTPNGEWDLNVIQTDAAINPGNSGGALINTKGQVIGINSLKISQNGVEGLGFAIPSNDVVPIINELIENGEVKRPYIGVSLLDVNEMPMYYKQNSNIKAETGTMVAKVDSTSPAAKAGLQVEDVIVGIDDVEVKDASDLRKYLYTEVNVGDEVELKINRNGTIVTLGVILTE